MKKWQDVRQSVLSDKEVSDEFDALEAEFALYDTLITLRTTAHLSQDEIANKLGTSKSNISRLESGRGNPTWKTITEYARACGYTLRLAPEKC